MARLYIITRADLPPGLQAAQVAHAAVDFTDRFPHIISEWKAASNNVVVLSVPDEGTLWWLLEAAFRHNIPRVSVTEPDIENQLTAIALDPSEVSRSLCANIPLALKESAVT